MSDEQDRDAPTPDLDDGPTGQEPGQEPGARPQVAPPPPPAEAPSPGEPGDEAADPRATRQQHAQSAAGDLARMGIDPRSLGLTAPAPPAPPARSARPPAPPPSGPISDRRSAQEVREADEAERENVVPLRPGTTGQPAPAEPEPEPDPVRRPTTFEDAVARTGAPPSARPDPMRVVRTVARVLATPDMAASVQQERELVDAVRRRQTDRRVVAFVSGKGGVGCTSVAVGVGTTLTALREDRSVVVDVQQGTASLGGWLGIGQPRSLPELVAVREGFEAPLAASGLGVIDGPGWDGPVSRNDVSGMLERLGLDHTFHLLDVGDEPGDGGHSALARADVVVLVTGPGPTGAAAATSALDRVRYVNPQAAGRMVSVVVCPHEASFRSAQRELAPGSTGFPGLVVPPDPGLQVGAGFDPGRLSPATREALLRVSAAVVVGSEG